MTIYEQLKEYCSCEKKINDKDVDELINLVSMATCWTNSPCETFLIGDRKEIKTLPNCKEHCDIYEFKPFYHPYTKDSFVFKIIKQDGLNEEEIELKPEDIAYSEIDEVFRINLPMNECKHNCSCGCFSAHDSEYCGCHKPKCSCDSTYKLVVTYEAGFNEIPECLLPVFCDLLNIIEKKNQCDCGCTACGDDNYNNNLDYGEYTVGDVLSYETLKRFGKLLATQYHYQLGLITLCDRVKVWGFVV